jgi:hypothetical protein
MPSLPVFLLLVVVGVFVAAILTEVIQGSGPPRRRPPTDDLPAPRARSRD